MPRMRRVLRLAAIPVLAAAAIALVACSGDGDATSTPEGTPTATTTGTSSPTATSTSTGATTETATATPKQTEEPSGEPTVDDAVDALQAYFDAIDAGDYATAYATWSSGGQASGQTFEEFRAGFANTESVLAEIGEPGRVDPAAGSRYVEIPVTIISTLTDGTVERFQGAYVFRRAVVDGATPEQRSWRIYSANIEQVAP
ncbi:MAG: hypothetical protein WEA81_00990 [Dehalococcoidia bacterium]